MRNRFLGGVLLTVLLCSLTFGQVQDIDLSKPLGEQLTQMQPPTGGQKPVMEGPVDPEEFVLGPSDVLEFNIWGGIELSYELIIAPDGSVAIPGVGEAQLAGLTLADARSRVYKLAAALNPKSKFSLRLVSIREMKVAVSGVVLFPGSYGISAVDRVSSLISTAGGFLGEEKEIPLSTRIERRAMKEEMSEDAARTVARPEQKIPQPALRRLKITGKDGEVSNLDYLRFLRSGKLEFNPMLRDGDAVHIPIKESGFGVISIFGEVKIPGEYEFIPGDDIAALIDVAGGLTTNALLETATLSRFDKRSGTFSRQELNLKAAAGTNFKLMPEDRIFIRLDQDIKPKHFVTIKGEVKFPGVYPIDDNTTMLSSLIEAAGGFKEAANLRNAVITRWIETNDPDVEYSRLEVVPVEEMTELEYEYYKATTRQGVPKVTVDFEELFIENDKSRDIALRDLDEIIIPTLSATIRVAGSVVNPGLVGFKPGSDFKFYVNEAGGYTFNAQKNKLRLIKSRTGVWVELDEDTPIEIGDTIFIPEKEEVNSWEQFKDVLLVLTQLATITLLLR